MPATSDAGNTFSERVKNEACQVRWHSVNDRQAVVAGAFCGAAPSGMPFPATRVRSTQPACIHLAGLLSQDGFVHLVRGNKVMILEQSLADFYTLMSSCFLSNAVPQLTADETFVRGFLRGAFLTCGYIADPSSTYRVEYRISNTDMAELIVAMLKCYNIIPMRVERDSYELIYFKNGDMVSDFLRVLGTSAAVMDFENHRAERELRSQVNRVTNCDSGNISRTADASARRGLAFDKIVAAGLRGSLPPELQATLDAHYANPEASITELGQMMDPPIGKSGMNHRIQKLMEIAEKVK
ncbi:DNA-binding protein WhiA [Ruminococcaceae bacterium YRB3002]|nr:DNA-binding protein WhiA [Ruminococcaceae bacterium YRB3002]